MSTEVLAATCYLRATGPSGRPGVTVRWTMRFHGILMGSFSIVLLLSGILAASAQGVPVLDLNPICRGIAQGAAGPGERGGPDLSFARCVRSEQATRKNSSGCGPNTPQAIGSIAWRKRPWAGWRATLISLAALIQRERQTRCFPDAISLIELSSKVRSPGRSSEPRSSELNYQQQD